MKPTKEEVIKKQAELTMRDTLPIDDWRDMCEWYHEQCNEGAITLEWVPDSSTADVQYFDANNRYIMHVELKRPSPKRTPQVNDKVFWSFSTDSIHLICGIDNDGKVLLTRIAGWQNADTIKPATFADMGKPWDEVRGY
jgi:hypothetical protein